MTSMMGFTRTTRATRKWGPILALALRQAMVSIGNLQGLKMEESEHITAAVVVSAQKAMADLKDNLRAIVKINKDAGRDEIFLVARKRLSELEALHAQMGLDLLKYFPDVSVRGPGR